MAREVTPALTLTTPGFWCERFVHRSAHADDLASWTAVATQSPVRAVRIMSADARKTASGLSGRERQRVLGRVSSQGQVGAMAALDRHEPCGLALTRQPHGTTLSAPSRSGGRLWLTRVAGGRFPVSKAGPLTHQWGPGHAGGPAPHLGAVRDPPGERCPDARARCPGRPALGVFRSVRGR